jgi:tocopherol O-methyltransferase
MSITNADIGSYYDLKTDKILREFGPGPIVHYHTGIRCPELAMDDVDHRFALFAKESQRNVLDMMIEKAGAGLDSGALVIDLGCGLGGACLYLATKLKVKAIGVSLSRDNIEKCREFARQMDLDERVEFFQADALTFEYDRKADAALAIESACYMDRGRLFANARALLKPGSSFHIFDWEVAKASSRVKRVDRHWKTSMGAPREYREAALVSGFELVEELDFNEDAVRFFEVVREWNRDYFGSLATTSYVAERMKQTFNSLDDLINGFSSREILAAYQLFRLAA